MSWHRKLALAVALLLLSVPASAQVPMTGAGTATPGAGPPPGYQGPGDIVASGWTGFWGLNGFTAAYSTGKNPAAEICDTATGATCVVINVLSNGYFDTATASGNAACVIECAVKTLYDQTGGGNNLTPFGGPITNGPVLIFNCLGSLPCMRFNGTNSRLVVSNIGGSQPVSGYSVIYPNGTGSAFQSTLYFEDAGGNANIISINDIVISGPTINVDAGTPTTAQAITTSNWHAVTGTANSASSFSTVDGTAGTTSNAGSNIAGNRFVYGAGYSVGIGNYFNGDMFEGGILVGTALSSSQASSLSTNAHSRLGF